MSESEELEGQNLPNPIFHGLKLGLTQVAQLRGDHVVLERSDNPRDDRRIQQTRLASRLDFVVSVNRRPSLLVMATMITSRRFW